MAADYERRSDGSYVRHSPVADGKNDDDRNWATAKDPTSALWTLVRSLRNRQTWRRKADDLALHLYSDMRYVGYRGDMNSAVIEDVIGSRLGENFIRAIVRAMNSKLARRRSRPYVVTNDGSWAERQAAENLEKWLLGKLREQEADEKVFPLFRLHAFVFGTGCVRVSSTEERGPYLEVIPPNEIIVDDSEGRYGDPHNIYFIRTVSKSKLLYDYGDDPKTRKVIEEMSTSATTDREWGSGVGAWDRENTSDVGIVIEAYHLPSGPDAGDGRHVGVVSSGVIFDEEWERDHFPCAWLRGELRPMGFWGIGVPEDLSGQQVESSRLALARQEMIELLANPYWLVERGSKVQKSAISSLIGRVMEWTSTGSGHKPELVAMPVVPPDVWQQSEALKKAAFETKGVSQLSAQMLKPAGLNSGKALRAYQELESELLADIMNSYENALLQVCQLMIEEQQALGKESASQAVTYVGKGKIETIRWNEINFAEALKSYVIEILPASALASTLSARIEDVYDMRDLGLLTDPGEIEDYLDMPDRRRVRRRKLSDRQLIEKVVYQSIVQDGEYVQPKPTWNLKLAKQTTLDAINELELYEDAPQDRLADLRKFFMACVQTEQQMLPPAGEPPMGPEGMVDNGVGISPGGTDLSGGLDALSGGAGPEIGPGGVPPGLPPGPPGGAAPPGIGLPS